METQLNINIEKAVESLQAMEIGNTLPIETQLSEEPFELKIFFGNETRRWRLVPNAEGFAEFLEFISRVGKAEKFNILLNGEVIGNNQTIPALVSRLSLFQLNHLVVEAEAQPQPQSQPQSQPLLIVQDDRRITKLERKIASLQDKLLKLKSKPMKKVEQRERKKCNKKRFKNCRAERVKVGRCKTKGIKNKEFSMRIMRRKCTFPPKTVKPGEEVQSTMVLFNNGTSAWPEGSFLKSIGRKCSPKAENIPLARSVLPGEELSVVIMTKAPEDRGKKMCPFKWHLVTPSDEIIGSKVVQRYKIEKEDAGSVPPSPQVIQQ